MNEREIEKLERRFAELDQRRETLMASLSEDGTVSLEQSARLDDLLLDTTAFEKDLRAYTGLNTDAVRERMGTNLIGPDVWEKIGIDCGNDPLPLPECITEELLYTECQIGEGLIKDTNRLVYVPAGLTVLELVTKANEWCEAEGQNPAFWNERMSWLKGKEFANEPAAASWVLLPLVLLPDSENKSDAEQEAVLKANYAEYETPDFKAVFFALIGEYLQTGVRTWPGEYGRCQNNVLLGFFGAAGLNANQYDSARGLVGRAVCRKLKI